MRGLFSRKKLPSNLSEPKVLLKLHILSLEVHFCNMKVVLLWYLGIFLFRIVDFSLSRVCDSMIGLRFFIMFRLLFKLNLLIEKEIYDWLQKFKA